MRDYIVLRRASWRGSVHMYMKTHARVYNYYFLKINGEMNLDSLAVVAIFLVAGVIYIWEGCVWIFMAS